MGRKREDYALLWANGMSFAEVFDLMAEDLKAEDEALRIVARFQIEANDYGGVDINDLVDRLRDAGYPLPDVDE